MRNNYLFKFSVLFPLSKYVIVSDFPLLLRAWWIRLQCFLLGLTFQHFLLNWICRHLLISFLLSKKFFSLLSCLFLFSLFCRAIIYWHFTVIVEVIEYAKKYSIWNFNPTFEIFEMLWHCSSYLVLTSGMFHRWSGDYLFSKFWECSFVSSFT